MIPLSVMELTEHQKSTLSQWAEQGYSLSEIQKRLAEEMGIAMTYMEARFLALDMGLNIRDKAAPSARRLPQVRRPICPTRTNRAAASPLKSTEW